MSTSTLTPLSKLSTVNKRKRDDPPHVGSSTDPLFSAASSSSLPLTSAFAATSTLLQTPRLRQLQHSNLATNAPSTPLLSLPSPSADLLPVLNARAARANTATDNSNSATTLVAAAATPSGLLRSVSSSAANISASSHSASISTQLRSLESASADRERSLRLQVEELRSTSRARASEVTELQLKAQQREIQVDAMKLEYENKLEKLQSQLRFVYGEEQKESSELKSNQRELQESEQQRKMLKLHIAKLESQLNSVDSGHPVTSEGAGKIAELEARADHWQQMCGASSKTTRELELQLASAREGEAAAQQIKLQLEEMTARYEHVSAQLAERDSVLRSGAAATAIAEASARRAGEFLAAQTKADSLQMENARLKEQKQNAALTQEQLLLAHSKIARLEAQVDESARVQLENERLTLRLKEWEDSVSSLNLPDDMQDDNEMSDISTLTDSPSHRDSKRRKRELTPFPFLNSYHSLQSTNLSLQSRLNQLELQAKFVAKEKIAVEEKMASLTQQVSESAQLSTQLVSVQRQVTLLTKEKQGLEKVLDAYDNEQRINPTSTSAVDTDADVEQVEQHKALKTRLKFLEEVVSELEKMVSEYYQQHSITPPTHVTPTSTASPIPSVLSLISQVSHLEKQLSHVESITSDLTDKVDWVNRHYPQLLDKEFGNYKILTLPSNPTYERLDKKHKADLDAANTEIQILKLKCEEIKQAYEQAKASGQFTATPTDESAVSSSASSVSPIGSSGISASAVLELKSSYESRLSTLEGEKSNAEKKIVRMTEVFQKKVTEFRHLYYRLTGYKLEQQPGGNVKLTHVYGEKESDHLLFQNPANAGNKITLLESEFTKSLDESIMTYLSKFDSIPGFLAAITMQLLEKQTRLT